jgi:aldehyde dehydrogenase (NAD+)
VLMEPGHVRVRRDPFGVTLIIGAWNEPYMLTLAPLVAAIAAGNTAVLKPSEISEAAAKNLTPAVLELGGKNPCIVHSSAQVKTAARRIAFGRLVNSGHICTAPDHVLVWPEVKDELVAELKQAITDFYGDDPKQSPDYGRVINRRNFDRLAGFLSKDNGTIAAGGQTDPDQRYIAPTVLVDVPVNSPIMQEEVFGPILPVLEIDSVEAVIDWVNERPRPLGLYVFTEDEDVAERILDATNSGDACINDCSVHPLVPELPFGGVGNSGMGKYHGRWGFEAFTNARGVLYHGARIDPGVKYPPYAEHPASARSWTNCCRRARGGDGRGMSGRPGPTTFFRHRPCCGSGLPVVGSGIRSAGSVAGLGQHPAQVDNCLGVDVLVGRRVEVFGLGPDGHGNLAAVLLFS